MSSPDTTSFATQGPERAGAAPPAASRALTVVAGLTISLHAVLAWIVRATTIGTGNDDAVYLLLARALRDGHYRELFYVASPIHSQYPPGYPSLLALLGAPLDGDVGLVIAANIALSCAALALLFAVIREWSAPLATATLAILAVNPALVQSASRVQSEPMFMAGAMLTLWALRPSAGARHRWLAIAAVILASLTRSAGLAIVAGVFAHFILSRAWRHAAALAVVSLFTIVPWLAWTFAAPQQVAGRSYVADALLTMPRFDSTGAPIRTAQRPDVQTESRISALSRTLRLRLRVNTRQYLTRSLPTRLAIPTVPNTPIDNAAWLAVMIVAVGAGAVAAWTRWRAAVLVLGAYAALLVLWPYAVGRFLVPVLPVLVALILLGAWRIGARLLPRAALVPALAIAALPLFGGGQAMAALVRHHGSCDPAEQEDGAMCAETAGRYREVAQYVDRRMGGPGPVFTTKEGAFFYHTQRPAVSVYPALGLAPDRLAAYLRDRGAAMIFLPHLRYDERSFAAPLAAICASLTDAGSPADDMLMLFVRPPRAGEQTGCAAVARWEATW